MTADNQSELNEIIDYINRHISDPISLSDLAKVAGYSPYHFTRLFKTRTGLSPIYFISSLKLNKAKDLLLHTQLNVRDISLEIGQQSLGTFTTRFTERVGMTPSQFRESRQQAIQLFHSLRHLPDWRTPQLSSSPLSVIEGTVSAVVPFDGFVLIGLFPKPIPEGLPLYGTLLPALGDFRFTGVKPGTYYLMATSVSWEMDTTDYLLPQKNLRTRSREPIVVKSGIPIPCQQVALQLPRADYPPILISLPLLMGIFLKQISQNVPYPIIENA